MKKVLSKSVIISTIISVVMLAAGILIGFLIWGNGVKEDEKAMEDVPYSYGEDDSPAPIVVGDTGSAYYHPEDEPTLTFEEAFADTAKYNGYYAMQDMTADICSNVATGQTTTLIDKRDNKTYQVSKLKMNPAGTKAQCWMTQNLALELSTSKTLTNEDTDLNTVTSWTPSRNTLTNVSQYTNDNNTPYSYNPDNASYGIYYNFSAAVASNNTSSMTAQYTNAPDSICPKGWRLPQVYGGKRTNRPNEFGNLLYSYGIINNIWPEPGDGQNAGWTTNGYTEIQQAPINGSLVGSVLSGAVHNLGVNGRYWSSSVHSAARAYHLGFSNTAVYPQYYNSRYSGFSVRCILR